MSQPRPASRLCFASLLGIGFGAKEQRLHRRQSKERRAAAVAEEQSSGGPQRPKLSLYSLHIGLRASLPPHRCSQSQSARPPAGLLAATTTPPSPPPARLPLLEPRDRAEAARRAERRPSSPRTVPRARGSLPPPPPRPSNAAGAPGLTSSHCARRGSPVQSGARLLVDSVSSAEFLGFTFFLSGASQPLPHLFLLSLPCPCRPPGVPVRPGH